MRTDSRLANVRSDARRCSRLLRATNRIATCVIIQSVAATAQKQTDGTYRIICTDCSHLIASEIRSPATIAPLIARHEKAECPALAYRDFENAVTRRFNEARMEFITPLLRELRKEIGLDSALDVGCGLGDFSDFLSQFGIQRVLGLDGRAQNVAEAQRRYPGIPFLVADVEELSTEIAVADLVLCFGLLYHLENPFRAIRRLHAVTGKVLLIESIRAPGKLPKLELMDEGYGANQGLSYIAFYPSEAALVKMLYYSGFDFVYGFEELPRNPLYKRNIWRTRMRTMLLASKQELNASCLVRLKDSPRIATSNAELWATPLFRIWSSVRAAIARVRSYAASILKSPS
jgi:SAM-dependent methyltransferase